MKAGLVKDKPVAKKRSSPKKNKQKPRKNNPPPKIEVKVLADNELPKETKLEIKKILKENRLNNKEGESPFNYTIGNQVKRCYITDEQLSKVRSGEIIITNWNDRSYLLSVEFLARLKELHPFLQYFYSQETSSESEDTAYQEHPIPEDLQW